MASVSSVETVTLAHKGGKGFEELKGREITVPVTAARVWAKTGWEPKKGADAKRVAEVVEKGVAPVSTASTAS